MDVNICSVCHKTVQPGLSIRHEVCGHYSHASCMDQVNPNFDHCETCVNAPPPQTQGTAVKSVGTQAKSLNGRDYVATPVGNSATGRLWNKMTRKVEHLKSGLPLKHLMAEHGYDLQYLLSQGVTLDELLQCGYSVHDLDIYDDVAGRNGNRRQKLALIALDVTANHFRDHPELLKKLDDPRDLCMDFGLYFPLKGCQPLSVFEQAPAIPLTLDELAEMGLHINDLIDAGLQYWEQYDDLQPTKRAENAMGITQKIVDNLPQYEQPHGRVVIVEERRPQIVQEPLRRERYVVKREKEPPKIKRHHRLKK